MGDETGPQAVSHLPQGDGRMSQRKKIKIQRSLGIELPGLGKPGALEKRTCPPGRGGRERSRKTSEFGGRLKEKQEFLSHYGLREEQLRRFVRKACSVCPSNWINTPIGLLERRLDNVVFRLRFARSISQARQPVSHGHIVVNGCCQTIGWIVLRLGERVHLSGKSREMKAVLAALEHPASTCPPTCRSRMHPKRTPASWSRCPDRNIFQSSSTRPR